MRILLYLVSLLFILQRVRACPRICVCGYYSKVHSLDCNSQDLYQIPQDIPEWTTLVRLDGNNLEVLDLSFCRTCVYFEEFSIRYNNIHKIITRSGNTTNASRASSTGCRQTLPIFPRLATVNLRGNRLQKLPKCLLFVWPVLKILNLNENLIKSWKRLYLSGDFLHTHSLEELRLNGNRISQLSNEDLYSMTLGLNRLKVLDLSHNRIHTVESGVFTFMDELREIDLSKNKLGYLPDFTFVTRGMKMETINLSGNYIDWISLRTFAGLPNLKVLDLSHNEIQCISSMTWSTCQLLISQPNIQELNEYTGGYVFDSRTSHFLKKFKIDFPLLRSVDLSHNQWSCDCKLKQMMTHNETAYHVINLGKSPCTQPIEHRDSIARTVLESLLCRED